MAAAYLRDVAEGKGPRSIDQFISAAASITTTAEKSSKLSSESQKALQELLLQDFVIALVADGGMKLEQLKAFGLEYAEDRKTEKISLKMASIRPMLERVLQKRPELREVLHRSVALIPLRSIAFSMHRRTKAFWESTHVCDEALEIAEARYMIGALYLNHYAVWSEDDKINIARNLLKTTSSQVIWHEAVSDEAALADPRVMEVADEIGTLPSHLVHPRVLLIQRGMKPHD